ncbi:hypothetical protein NDK47_00835 [Brevibacillus ruminantium]|uniref:Uncharacterized protein n=1 Tax=Brevibacillus ruminantium TaxID=2950604 RepID=A0ABY4WJ98_9BACL|nr:hypothetical protein [Brevibacillus ruminantium]USG65935.1 hypothetical protein NDK47_00835 [Brevibacillus ruminantium]
MKKIFSSFFSLMLLTSLVSGVAVAGNSASTKEVSFSTEETKDLSALFEMAKNNITEYKEPPNARATLSKDGNVQNVRVYQTTKRLKTERNIASGDQKDSYVTYYFYGVPKEAIDNESISTFGSTSDDDFDSSYSVQAYSTYFWDRYKDTNGNGYKKLTKVTGGWTIHDNKVSITNREVKYGASGGSLRDDGTHGGSVIQDSGILKPTSNSFSYNAPTSWKPVFEGAGTIGVNTTATLKLGSETWTLRLNNYQ